MAVYCSSLSIDDNSGKYDPNRWNYAGRWMNENNGRYMESSGRYVNKNDGRYIPMNDRAYQHVHDNRELGIYHHVHIPYNGGYGPYSHIPNPYLHVYGPLYPYSNDLGQPTYV